MKPARMPWLGRMWRYFPFYLALLTFIVCLLLLPVKVVLTLLLRLVAALGVSWHG